MPHPAMATGPSHIVEDQSAVFTFLEDPATHGVAVTRIDTHGAAVFLVGADAYKVKRAVRFPFMDFSTLEKRRRACQAEVEINGPGAPGIYLGVTCIARDGDRLVLDGDGEVADFAVHMRRFDETLTLDRVAAAGGLEPGVIRDLVAAVHASHARAPRRPGEPAAEALARYLDQNREAFAEQPDVFPAERADRLVRRSKAEWTRLRPLLMARGEAGYARRCHGDLHLRNIVLIDGRPTLFDAIEFDDGIATGDVLYDLAFLIMDLWERGLRQEAGAVLSRYLWSADPGMIGGLEALPLVLSIRATIRAKVVAAGLSHLVEAARPSVLDEVHRYFDLAEATLEPVAPVVVAVGGLSGTGKSTLAAEIAPFLGRIPGAVHLRSDVIRKRLAGVGETERLPSASYTPEATAAVYRALRSEAAAVLRTGASVIVDAVHARPDERDAVAAVAADAGVRFVGIWLAAPLAVLTGRVAARRDDASDATPEVVRGQAARETGRMDWATIDAAGARADVLAAARSLLDAPP
ncbi:MAG TPA: AAA family ATPase [Methylomirabilota bacterium]|nr:AAA family ATPase [Methylomirabilota bacterium]